MMGSFDQHAANTRLIELEVMNFVTVAEALFKDPTNATGQGGKLEWLNPANVQNHMVAETEQWQVKQWMLSQPSKNKGSSEFRDA